jgi:hypothetical protein
MQKHYGLLVSALAYVPPKHQVPAGRPNWATTFSQRSFFGILASFWKLHST